MIAVTLAVALVAVIAAAFLLGLAGVWPRVEERDVYLLHTDRMLSAQDRVEILRQWRATMNSRQKLIVLEGDMTIERLSREEVQMILDQFEPQEAIE